MVITFLLLFAELHELEGSWRTLGGSSAESTAQDWKVAFMNGAIIYK